MFVRVLALGILLLATAPVTGQDLLSKNPELREILEKHQDGLIPDGQLFANEPLECAFYRHAFADYVIADGDGDPAVIFTSVRTEFAGYFLYPNILSRDADGNWRRTSVPVVGDGWTHIHQSANGTHLLVAMDNIPESAGWETRFVLSEDAGRTWRYVSEFRKYVYFDRISYFRMSDAGEGVAVEYYGGDIGGFDDTGYYIFRTSDWGRNWSAREYLTEFDAAGFDDVIGGFWRRRDNRKPLREVIGPDLVGCPVDDIRPDDEAYRQ